MSKVKSEYFQSVLVRKYHPLIKITSYILMLTIIGIIPVLLLSMFLRELDHGARDSFQVEIKKRLIDYIGGTPDYIDVSVLLLSLLPGSTFGFSCIAIKGDTIYIVTNNNKIGTIPWGAVRDWRWSKVGYDVIKPIGVPYRQSLAVNLEANSHNRESMIDAAKASGVYLKVADIDNPEWHFQSNDEVVMKRWNEILKQQSEKKAA